MSRRYINKTLEAMGVDHITAIKPWSSNPKDAHLACVLHQNAVDCKYVVHAYNHQDGSYFWGHYFDELKDALKDFNSRGNE